MSLVLDILLWTFMLVAMVVSCLILATVRRPR